MQCLRQFISCVMLQQEWLQGDTSRVGQTEGWHADLLYCVVSATYKVFVYGPVLVLQLTDHLLQHADDRLSRQMTGCLVPDSR